MPHVYDMVGQLFEPSRRNGPLLIDVLLDAAAFTAKEAAAGFVLGAVRRLRDRASCSRSRLLQRGFLPYIVASQTMPILAIAPMVVIWLDRGCPVARGWGSVAVISAYLTFFPVTINTLRGLRSADPRALELMRSYAAGRWTILLEAADPGLVPVPVHGAEDRRSGLRRRRDHRRAALVDPGRAGRGDPQLQPVLHHLAREPLGDEHHRGGARHPLLRRRRDRREAARPPRTGARRVSAAAAAVSITGLSKRFERGDVLALDRIDLDVQPGEFVSLIGPSGCGKSTLLRIIGDLIQPTEGDVLVNGKSAHQARLDRDYGIVFQDAVLYDWRTVAKNIALPLEMAGWDRRRREGRVREMLELVELTGFEKHHPWQLSGGMQQRVSIARALSFSPPLLLMDEPFGALDEMTRERMNNELLRIWQETLSTVVFVTHSIAESVFLSTRVVVMSARPGRIAGIVEIDLPQPRGPETREHPHFAELITQVRAAAPQGSRARCAGRGRDAALRRGGGPVSVVAPVPRGTLGARVGRGAVDWIPAALVLVLGIVLWEGLVRALDVQRFLLPAPSAILDTLWEERDLLWSAGIYTFSEALGGFVIGSTLGDHLGDRPRALPRPRPGADAVRDRRQRRADHRLRADHEPVVRAAREDLEDGDRRDPRLLPGDGEHAARPDVGAAAIDRADALLRGGRDRDLSARADPELAAVPLLGLEGGDRAGDDRRNRGRVLPQLAGGARVPDQKLGRALPVRARVGGDHGCERARNPVLLGCRTRRAAGDELASVFAEGVTGIHMSRGQTNEGKDTA